MTTDELLRRGTSARQIQTLLARGILVRLGRGVYARAAFLERIRVMQARETWLRAAASLATSAAVAVASHETAAEIHGLDLLTRPAPMVSVTRPPGPGSRSGKRDVHVHAAALPAEHVGGRFGVPVTTVPRTVVDLARKLDFRSAVVAADSALHQHLTSKRELGRVLAACRGWPGASRAARVIEFADGLSESVLESIARVLFQDLGLPPPELQVEISSDGEFIGRADFLWRRFRTIAEVDGALKYDADPMRARSQLRRDKQLRRAGYEVEHFDWREINSAGPDVGRSLLAAFDRARQLGASGPAA